MKGLFGVTASLAVALLLLSGCSAASKTTAAPDVPPTASGPAPSTPSEASTPAAFDPDTPWPTLPPGVVATGTFTNGTDEVSGSASVVHEPDDSYTLQLSDFSCSNTDPLLVVEVSNSILTTDPIRDQPGSEAALGNVNPTGDQSFPLFIHELNSSLPPQNIQSVAILTDSGAAPSGIALLDWSAAPVQQISPVDAGPAAGATGTVEITAAGALASYTVAPGDTLKAVTQRFGLTISQLYYLTPVRRYDHPDPVLDETLNLDPAAR